MKKNNSAEGKCGCAAPKAVRKTKIGGQAVLEGVMMRGNSSMALACRDETGAIRLDTTRLATTKPWYRRVPFVRGVVNMVISMTSGIAIIGKSAEVMVEDVDTKGNGNGMGWMMALSTLLGLVLALALFIVVPTYLTQGIFVLAKLSYDPVEPKWVWLKSLLEGVFKLLVLVGYMGGISCMKEIKRVFMYHGAEHKTIACYEAGLDLTVENVKKCSRYHDRCGTSFLVFVVILSVLLMMVFDVVFALCADSIAPAFQSLWGKRWFRVLFKIALLPVTAGISYEFLMLLARTDFVLFRPFKWLGKQFQRLTTREPDEGMCQVAIAAFNAVLLMDADPSVQEQHFPQPIGVEQFRLQLREKCPELLQAVKGDEDWLLCAILNLSKEQINSPNVKIPFGYTIRLEKIAAEMRQDIPWQYAVGRTQFYGRNFELNRNVLIPRLETELVCEQLLKHVADGAKLLDMCCGSGVLGITAACEKGCQVTLADKYPEPLIAARANAKRLGVKADVVQTDMFEGIKGTFDAIVCNPPYVRSGDIPTLDKSVLVEPHTALDGGADGLDFFRVLAREAPKHLCSNGLLVLEIGYDQGAEVQSLLQNAFDVQVMQDYSQNDRIVVAKLK